MSDKFTSSLTLQTIKIIIIIGSFMADNQDSTYNLYYLMIVIIVQLVIVNTLKVKSKDSPADYLISALKTTAKEFLLTS